MCDEVMKHLVVACVGFAFGCGVSYWKYGVHMINIQSLHIMCQKLKIENENLKNKNKEIVDRLERIKETNKVLCKYVNRKRNNGLNCISHKQKTLDTESAIIGDHTIVKLSSYEV